MLITFKSKSAADILMYEVHARPLLELLGKPVERGIITAEQTGDAIACLEAAIREGRPMPATPTAGEDESHDAERRVSFGTRAFPLLEMLRAAQRDHEPVMWGI